MIGEPDAGNPHVRFDEGVQETCDLTRRACALLHRSPQKNVAPLLSTGFADSAPSQISLFRRIHVSALNFCMSLFRLRGCRNQYVQPRWASELTALTLASTKELAAAGPSARDRPLAW